MPGLIGCSGYDLVTILQKQRQKLPGISIRATGEQLDKEPYAFTKIDFEYVVLGSGINSEFVSRAICGEMS